MESASNSSSIPTVSLSAHFEAIKPTPTFSVQPDWEIVLREFTQARQQGELQTLPKESKQFWASLNYGPVNDEEKQDVYVDARLNVSSDAPEVSSSSSLVSAARSVVIDTSTSGENVSVFDMSFLGPMQLLSHHADSHTTTLFQASRSSWRNHPSGEIYSCDISSNGIHGISGGENGSIRLWDANSGAIIRSFDGAKGDVHLTRFFPSGTVALTSGLDLKVRIWSCDSGLEAASLTGHSRSVTSVNFIERGRHLVTTSEDGEARLWDVSTQQTMMKYPEGTDRMANSAKVNGAVLIDPHSHPIDLTASSSSSVGAPSSIGSSLPSSSHGSLLLTASSDGFVRAFDLRSRLPVFILPTGTGNSGGIQAIAIGPRQHSFTIGTAEGIIATIDLRKRHPLYSCRRDDAGVTSIRPWSSDSFWTTNTTGSASLWQFDSNGNGAIAAEFTGVDCEPIHDMCVTSNYAYLASRDAIRVYSLTNWPKPDATKQFHEFKLPQRQTITNATTSTTNTSAN